MKKVRDTGYIYGFEEKGERERERESRERDRCVIHVTITLVLTLGSYSTSYLVSYH